MDKILSVFSNVVTILSFPATIFFIVRELRKNNKTLKKNNQEIRKLTQTIVQQNTIVGDSFVNNGKIDTLNMHDK